MQISTWIATSNIAVVKYWGKRNEELILPQNNSLSFTMDETLKTITSVMFSQELTNDDLWLNGKQIDLSIAKNRSHLFPIEMIRERANTTDHVRIVSKNLFPTGAGFASSASGVAALVCAAADAAGLSLSKQELSMLARRGSGSAARSVFGGFVEWLKGEKEDGSDSYAEQIVPHDHWPEIRNLVIVLAAEEKDISSRQAMKSTVATSPFFQKRLEVVPQTIAAMKEAIKGKNFPAFAELTMRESNNMHAAMLDSWPPIMYLSDASKTIIKEIEKVNASEPSPIAAYTFDAGPNAHIYTTATHVERLQQHFQKLDIVKNTLVCSVGSGPRKVENQQEWLINPESGSPIV